MSFGEGRNLCPSCVEARLKEALDVLHDIVVLLRKEPAVQGPRFSDLGFRASSILSKNGR
jgi:hypothetical protein